MLWPDAISVGSFVQFDAGPDESAREVIVASFRTFHPAGLLSADPVVDASTVQAAVSLSRSTAWHVRQMTFVRAASRFRRRSSNGQHPRSRASILHIQWRPSATIDIPHQRADVRVVQLT
jgi:hypothetical protein